ncbi:MAG: NADH-quinone oxidoreductase subunit J [Myxococcaceae bacterium]|nr:NADH-quinone oxidoreductase subunit J [Myxococcaceae bacterium]MCI0671129.1 NADH-quinone oxidoreductase subunit J [Myxococcaceae bacterium]
MNAEVVLFYAFAVLALLSAGMVIASRSPINSALSLVATFFFLAGTYVLLLAHTIAVLQVLVYAGAIMVLFLFVIMLLNLTETEGERAKVTFGRVAGALAAVSLFALLALVVMGVKGAPTAMATAELARFGTLAALGQTLYTEWLLPFEAVSLLLLVAIVGAVVVAKARI